MVNIFEARKLAVRNGLGLQYVLKEFRIFDILQKIKPLFLDNEIIVVFKGGTALNKVYFQKEQRFSEDLDFDLAFKKVSDKKQRIKYIGSKVTKLLSGYNLGTRYMRDTIRITCSFLNELEKKDNVFLEFHLEDKIVGKYSLKNIRSRLIKKTIKNIPTYSLSSLLAKKIVAFSNRASGKDLYDLYYGFKIISKNDILKELKDFAKYKNLNYRLVVERVLEILKDKKQLEKMHPSSNPYIPKQMRKSFVEMGAMVFEEFNKF